jgi:hypothetical protein
MTRELHSLEPLLEARRVVFMNGFAADGGRRPPLFGVAAASQRARHGSAAPSV